MPHRYVPESELDRHAETLRKRATELSNFIEQYQRELSEVDARLGFISDLRRKAVALNGDSSTGGSREGTFSNALRSLIAREPGIGRDEAIERLFDKYHSKDAENPRRSLLTQIGNLARKHKIYIDEDKRLFPQAPNPSKKGDTGMLPVTDQARA